MSSRTEPASRALRRLRDLDPRPPLWDADALTARYCPFCDCAGEPFVERPDGLVVRLCGSCGCAFVSPAPDGEQVARFYRDYRGQHRIEAFAGTPYAARLELPTTAEPERLAKRIRSAHAQDDYRVQEVASLMELEGARVLDVGCGVGQLLHLLASLGAQVEGIDPDPDAVAFARDTLALEGVRQGRIEDIPREERYDLIVLQDVLEHMLEPRAVLERAASLLAPGGLLYLWTPNATFVVDDPEPLVLRTDWEHLQFASARTLMFLAGELGLVPLHLECTGYLGSLEDAEHHPGGNAPPVASQRQRALLRRLPGARKLSALRQAWLGRHPERSGTYHLFALLRRPPR